ncbi:DUF397 domain-containing protein [Streptomyces sp. NPDC006458]|uniref:DUF397 domain-containing protein n=1 Tax=Streptomyces sp. NPDC006458 TaxID=3154302 RepID=UPI0033A6415F
MAEAVDGGPAWFASSYSNGAGGECVECAFTDGGTLIRDSKTADAGVIAVTAVAWRAFVRTLRDVESTGRAVARH